jgi:hypothetical protein
MTMSSTVREWCEETEKKDDWRESGLPEVVETKSEISGRELSGGTKTVEREPVETLLALLSIERMVRMEPVGERVTETESGTTTGLLTVSLIT